jgi:hypothetical protein
MKAIVRDVRLEALEEAGVQLIVIGNGSAKMIDGYACKSSQEASLTKRQAL